MPCPFTSHCSPTVWWKFSSTLPSQSWPCFLQSPQDAEERGPLCSEFPHLPVPPQEHLSELVPIHLTFSFPFEEVPYLSFHSVLAHPFQFSLSIWVHSLSRSPAPSNTKSSTLSSQMTNAAGFIHFKQTFPLTQPPSVGIIIPLFSSTEIICLFF